MQEVLCSNCGRKINIGDGVNFCFCIKCGVAIHKQGNTWIADRTTLKSDIINFNERSGSRDEMRMPNQEPDPVKMMQDSYGPEEDSSVQVKGITGAKQKLSADQDLEPAAADNTDPQIADEKAAISAETITVADDLPDPEEEAGAASNDFKETTAPPANMIHNETVIMIPEAGTADEKTEKNTAIEESAAVSGDLSEEADIPPVNTEEADMPSADTGEADMPSADTEGADMPSADTGEADMPSADTGEADMPSANIVEADIQSANIVEADIPPVNIDEAAANNNSKESAAAPPAEMHNQTGEVPAELITLNAPEPTDGGEAGVAAGDQLGETKEPSQENNQELSLAHNKTNPKKDIPKDGYKPAAKEEQSGVQSADKSGSQKTFNDKNKDIELYRELENKKYDRINNGFFLYENEKGEKNIVSISMISNMLCIYGYKYIEKKRTLYFEQSVVVKINGSGAVTGYDNNPLILAETGRVLKFEFVDDSLMLCGKKFVINSDYIGQLKKKAKKPLIGKKMFKGKKG